MRTSAFIGAKNFEFFKIYDVSSPGVWKRKRKLEAKFCGSGSTLKKEAMEAEANSEAFDFLRSRKRKHFL